MALYENVFIARQDVPATQVETLTNQFAELITAQGGTVSKKEYWGLRSLTFRIKKNRKGHYTLLNIDAPPAAVKELERTMSINEDIIRFLTVRVDALEEGPSAVMQRGAEKSDRPGDRGDRGGWGDRPSRRERPRFGDDAAAATRAAVARSLPYLERGGVEWMEERGCMSCHHVPFRLWAHHAARGRGIPGDEARLAEWEEGARNDSLRSSAGWT